jgi:hypothetical protein
MLELRFSHTGAFWSDQGRQEVGWQRYECHLHRDIVDVWVNLTDCVLCVDILVPTNYRIKAKPNCKALTDEDKNLGRWVNRCVILFWWMCLNVSVSLLTLVRNLFYRCKGSEACTRLGSFGRIANWLVCLVLSDFAVTGLELNLHLPH